MPYTPPNQRSPAVSVSSSPADSRRPSYQPTIAPASSPRPELPRSTSYLTRHRRTPSAKTASFAPATEVADEPTPPATADDDKDGPNTLTGSASVRQSPSPVTDDSRMPAGAVLSPPESTQNSSDEEEDKTRGRQIDNLAELQAAIRVIEQHRQSSPTRQAVDVARANQALSLLLPTKEADLKSAEENIEDLIVPGVGRNGHQRSKTESYVDFKPETPLADSDDDESVEDDMDLLRMKPPMVRKKSGELVRPALRPSSARRRPSSMPGTPTFSKAVHFDAHLEHVRHFLQVDRPLAVSATSSPVEAYDSDMEFPFDSSVSSRRSPPFEWEITVANFPKETEARLQQSVRLDRVFLSTDNKTLIGSVVVANLGFQKTVVARFTLDYWKTTSEVVAEYNNDVRRKQQADGHDRFNFNIKLADQANLEAKTMFFCIKYCVNGQEFWDNNNNTNYQVDFKKKAKPQNGKRGMQGATTRSVNGLPRSNKKSPPTSSGRPKSMPATFDDFADGFDSKYSFGNMKATNAFLEEPPNPSLRLKGVKSAVPLASDNLTRRPPNPNGQAFSNRYDFGASLSAAIQAANNAMGEKSGLSSSDSSKTQGKKATPSSSQRNEGPKIAMAPSSKAPASGTESPRSVASEKPALASQSYNELLDKYCFFGSVKSSPQLKDGTLGSRPVQYDGNNDGYVLRSESPSPQSIGSPVQPSTISHPPQRPSPPRMDSGGVQARSTSPAPTSGFITGTSPVYPIRMHGGFPFGEAYTATAIRG
ncbi:MAG: hypothetical protein M1818_007180 [Claussenomyces sp. TS43310]|nr:MAG: hypothetical protein M1818_007180 [Claussenomyces sp. TS43310]